MNIDEQQNSVICSNSIPVELIKFVEYMNYELEMNKHKGDWKTFDDPILIINELEHHLNKLNGAISCNNIYEIREYIADCGNILLMLGNSYKLY